MNLTTSRIRWGCAGTRRRKIDLNSETAIEQQNNKDAARPSRNQRSADRRVRALLACGLEHADKAVRAPGESSQGATKLRDSKSWLTKSWNRELRTAYFTCRGNR